MSLLISNRILSQPLTLQQKAVLAHLEATKNERNRCHTFILEIAEYIGISKPTALTAIKVLQKKKYIFVIKPAQRNHRSIIELKI